MSIRQQKLLEVEAQVISCILVALLQVISCFLVVPVATSCQCRQDSGLCVTVCFKRAANAPPVVSVTVSSKPSSFMSCVPFRLLQGLSAGVVTYSVDCIATWTSIIVTLTIRHWAGKNWRKNIPKLWQPKSRNFSSSSLHTVFQACGFYANTSHHTHSPSTLRILYIASDHFCTVYASVHACVSNTSTRDFMQSEKLQQFILC